MYLMKHILLLVSFFLCLDLHAQMGTLFNADTHLPSNYVSQVYQDHDGYIWLATRNGLSRFDGYQFQTFNNQKNPSCNLRTNYINKIMQTRDGRFYISESNGIQYYDGGTFHHIPIYDLKGREVGTYVTGAIQLQNGDILASTSGYGVLKVYPNKAERLTQGILKSLSYITKIAEDHQQQLWVLTEDQGVFCVKNGKYRRYFSDTDRSASSRDIWIDKDDNVYICVRDKGLYLKKKNESNFQRINDVNVGNMECIHINKKGLIYIGTDGHGVYVYNPVTHQVKNNPYYCWGMNLDMSKVYSILEDRSGNVWLGMLQKGVFMQRAHHIPFGYMGYRLGTSNVIGTNCVSATLYDKSGHIWVGTDKDGIYLLDSQMNLLRHYYGNIPSTILNFQEDAEGRVWAGSYAEGFGFFDKSLEWHPVKAGLGSQSSVFSFACSKNGDVWISSMGEGLTCLHKDGTITKYRMKKGAESNRKINSLVNDYIQGLDLSKDEKRLYISTTVGLCCLDIQKGDFLNFLGVNCLENSSSTRHALEDGRGNLWIGTDNGLTCYNLKTHKRKIYTTRDGLANNDVMAMGIDNKNQLWVSTSNGLSRVNLKTGNIVCYFSDNGLQGNEFSARALTISSNGNFLFGGTGGISWFNPANIKSRPWNGNIKISGMTVGNRQLADSLVYNKTKFIFDHDDNSIAIHLSTLTYEDSENITYLYSINNETWERLQTGHNELTFARLSPGTYHFRVKALKDRFESEISEFTIVIKAPWYATTWAYLVYLLIIGTLIWRYLRHRRAKEQARLQLQEHIHAEEMGEAKLRFFMNMSHEIRTPMTLIISPLLQLLKEDHDAHRHSIYTIMHRNADRILHLINQMMDLRKIDKGLMAMRMRETDMVTFIEDVYTLFTKQAADKKIDFVFQHDDDKLPVWIDRRNFDKVLVNLLSNAFKYTSTGGNVTTKLSHTENELQISISDDGESIPEEKLKRIFDRFYQTPTAANDRNIGTGIGLDLTRLLVELHYGNIEAKNNADGKGCTFIVTLPLGNAHLKPEEIITDEQEINEPELTPSEINIEEAEVMEEDDTETTIQQDSKRPAIVIAEDDDEIAQYLETQLSTNYEITRFNNGKDALSAVLQIRPALLISDIMMPQMDGNTLCSRVKNNVNTNDIPVILLTAKTLEEDKLEGLETGADAYIVKPFNMDILKRTIFNLIHQREILRNKFNGNEAQDNKYDEIQLDSPDEKLMNKIMEVINHNLGNSDLSVDMIAKEVGVSRVHLYRKMKEITNQTPHSFFSNLRIKQAAKLLQDPHQSITEVMYACGFSSPASFSTTFKANYGVSPREYQKKYKN